MPSRPGRPGAARALTLLASVLPAALLLGSCSGGSGDAGDSSGGTGGKGYVAGNGVITTLAAHEREKPGPVAGSTLDGDHVALSDYAGQVVVVNVWGSWCPPCRAEAPTLAKAARDLGKQGVQFLGIDSRDPSRTEARAFVRNFDIPYPSIYDQSGKTLLAFHGTLALNSVPSTVVIDRQGRVAASVLGEVSKTTLYDLVQGVSTGSTGGSGSTGGNGAGT